MSDLLELLPLFWTSVVASLVAGAVLPWIGALLHLRREAFLGVAAPQFAAAGVAFGLWAVPWFPAVEAAFLEHGHPPMLYLLPFAGGTVVLALVLHGLLRPSRSSADAALAGGFALSGALAILFLSRAPAGANLTGTMLRGEVLLLDEHGLWALTSVLALVLLFLVAFRRTLLLGAIDPDQARVLGLPLVLVERVLPLALGAAVGAAVMTVGPVLVFGLLFLPSLSGAGLTRGLGGFLAVTALVGLLAVAGAWPVSFAADLPYGPVAAALAAVPWPLGLVLRAWRRRGVGRAAA